MKTSKFHSTLFLFLVLSLIVVACCKVSTSTTKILGVVPIPEKNEQSQAKIALGKQLFFDKQLSRDQTVSCATCHVPEKAFTDQKELSDGVFGRKSMRNAPSLLNVAYQKTLMFDGHITNLEEQAIVPIQDHFEMDMDMKYVVKRLRKNKYYEKAAKAIFGREFDAYVLTRSLSAYERTLVSANSRFDKFYYHKQMTALSASEKRGWKLFSEKLYCTQCHPGPHFTNFETVSNGYYTKGAIDKGRFRIHVDTNDIGKFKVPTLRNIAVTFPYMHDGKLKSLEEVIAHYEAGGKHSINQSPIVQPIKLSVTDRKDLIAFLRSLTDAQFEN